MIVLVSFTSKLELGGLHGHRYTKNEGLQRSKIRYTTLLILYFHPGLLNNKKHGYVAGPKCVYTLVLQHVQSIQSLDFAMISCGYDI